MMTIPNIQIGNIPSPFELRKYVIDYRQLPVCVEYIEETGFLRKRYVYYHNYGDHVSIIIVTIPFTGEPRVKKYNFNIEKRHLRTKAKHPKSNFYQYVS